MSPIFILKILRKGTGPPLNPIDIALKTTPFPFQHDGRRWTIWRWTNRPGNHPAIPNVFFRRNVQPPNHLFAGKFCRRIVHRQNGVAEKSHPVIVLPDFGGWKISLCRFNRNMGSWSGFNYKPDKPISFETSCIITVIRRESNS